MSRRINRLLEGIRRELDEAGDAYELVYSTGGHGGPYPNEKEAAKMAERMLRGNRNEQWVAVVSSKQLTRGDRAQPVAVLDRDAGWKKNTAGETLGDLGESDVSEAQITMTPSKMAPIEYTYEHPMGRLSVRYSGDQGWFVLNPNMKVVAKGLLKGTTPSDKPNYALILKNVIDKALG